MPDGVSSKKDIILYNKDNQAGKTSITKDKITTEANNVKNSQTLMALLLSGDNSKATFETLKGDDKDSVFEEIVKDLNLDGNDEISEEELIAFAKMYASDAKESKEPTRTGAKKISYDEKSDNEFLKQLYAKFKGEDDKLTAEKMKSGLKELIGNDGFISKQEVLNFVKPKKVEDQQKKVVDTPPPDAKPEEVVGATPPSTEPEELILQAPLVNPHQSLPEALVKPEGTPKASELTAKERQLALGTDPKTGLLPKEAPERIGLIKDGKFTILVQYTPSYGQGAGKLLDGVYDGEGKKIDPSTAKEGQRLYFRREKAYMTGEMKGGNLVVNTGFNSNTETYSIENGNIGNLLETTKNQMKTKYSNEQNGERDFESIPIPNGPATFRLPTKGKEKLINGEWKVSSETASAYYKTDFEYNDKGQLTKKTETNLAHNTQIEHNYENEKTVSLKNINKNGDFVIISPAKLLENTISFSHYKKNETEPFMYEVVQYKNSVSIESKYLDSATFEAKMIHIKHSDNNYTRELIEGDKSEISYYDKNPEDGASPIKAIKVNIDNSKVSKELSEPAGEDLKLIPSATFTFDDAKSLSKNRPSSVIIDGKAYNLDYNLGGKLNKIVDATGEKLDLKTPENKKLFDEINRTLGLLK